MVFCIFVSDTVHLRYIYVFISVIYLNLKMNFDLISLYPYCGKTDFHCKKTIWSV